MKVILESLENLKLSFPLVEFIAKVIYELLIIYIDDSNPNGTKLN